MYIFVYIGIALLVLGFYAGVKAEKWYQNRIDVSKYWVIHGDEKTTNLKEERYRKNDMDITVNYN